MPPDKLVWHKCDIARAELKSLMVRDDHHALVQFGLWFALLGASGVMVFVTWQSWWAVPALFVYGTIYQSSDARWHECAHRTCFRTRWLNEWIYNLTSFMTIRQGIYWRCSHNRHHSETLFTGRDAEIQVPRPANLYRVVLGFFYIHGGASEIWRTLRHAAGDLSDWDREIIQPDKHAALIGEARVYVCLWLAILGVAIANQSWLPVLLVITPRFYCGWLHQLLALTQHSGLAQNVLDHRLNARTVYINPIFRFLYMNMNYHIEHHMFPTVPYHALPRLHDLIKHQLPRTYESLWDCYKEMAPALIRSSRDDSYFLAREVP